MNPRHTAAVCLIALSMGACITPGPKPPPAHVDIGKSLNTGLDNLSKTKQLVLPDEFSLYGHSLQKLVGMLLWKVPISPGADCNNSFDFKPAYNVRSDNCQPEILTLNEAVCDAKVTGDWTAEASMVGHLKFDRTKIYDLHIFDSGVVNIPFEYKCLDEAKLQYTVNKTRPKTNCGAYVVFAVGKRTVTYREYEKYGGDGSAAIYVLNIGGKYYVSNDTTKTHQVLLFTPMDIGHLVRIDGSDQSLAPIGAQWSVRMATMDADDLKVGPFWDETKARELTATEFPAAQKAASRSKVADFVEAASQSDLGFVRERGLHARAPATEEHETSRPQVKRKKKGAAAREIAPERSAHKEEDP